MMTAKNKSFRRFAIAAVLIPGAILAIGASAPAKHDSGLAAHYYRDADQWGGNWGDAVSVPTVSPSQWTFTRYAYSRVESLINHQFVNSGWFTVRWQGILDTHPRPEADAATAQYDFEIWADDGCRLVIDGHTVINSWQPCAEDSPRDHRTASVSLTPGEHEIVVEYFQGQSLQNGDRDPIKLYWSCPARRIPRQIIPASHFSHDARHLTPEAGRLD